MSVLIGYRFKGIVKKELRDIFEPIALKGRWDESPDKFLRDFGRDPNAWKFPMSYTGYVRRWKEKPWQRRYNKTTGEWTFQVDMNWGTSPMEWWEPLIIPYCMESVSHYEEWQEMWADAWKSGEEYTRLHKFENGEFSTLGWLDTEGKFLTEEQFIEKVGLENYKWHILGEIPE